MIATMNNDNAVIRTTYMDITPEIAARWLEGNVRNRPVDQKHVDLLAQDMAAGKWRVTHQGIAFDIEGMLVDGQHRLWAILQSTRTVQMSVTFGLPINSIDSIDGVKARTTVDRMMLSGRFGSDGVNSHHAATLRNTVAGLNPPEKLSYHKEAQLMAQHIDAIRFATSHVSTKARGVSVSYVRAVIARAWYSIDHELLVTFCRILSTGMPESSSDIVIIKLRDQLMAVGGSRNPVIQRELYGKVERTLVAWLNGQVLTVIRPARAEYFPLTEEGAI